MFKGPRGLLVTLLGAAIVIAGAFYFGFQGQKDDAETSRLFLTHVAVGEVDQAYTLLHPSITERHTAEEISAMLQGMEVYTQVSFPSISFSNTNGSRFTELNGTGSTDSGCESALEFDLRDGLITFFDITPFCNGSANDA